MHGKIEKTLRSVGTKLRDREHKDLKTLTVHQLLQKYHEYQKTPEVEAEEKAIKKILDKMGLDPKGFNFKKFDKDGNHHLTEDELNSASPWIKDNWKRFDADGNGQLSYQEFQRMTK